ncbi:hypothetical protein MMA231_04247 (plasmid) [Asticcacaulis sp. MM231]|uniref:hypothetical protein n=1 Tax=Asticcacaulis sp. MM231 TaxID=3157666 RepID=UPI0032D57B11
MPYSRKLSSLHVISLMENLGGQGRIEFSIACPDEPVVLSNGLKPLLALSHSDPVTLEGVAGAIHASDRALFISDVTAMRRGQEPPPRIYRVAASLARSRYVSLTPQTLMSDDGAVQKIVCLVQDASATETLRRYQACSVQCIRTVMSFFDIECIWRADSSGRLFEHVTAGHLEGVAPNFDPLLPDSLHPDDRDRALSTIAQAMSTGEDFCISLRIFGADGVPRTYCKKGMLFNNDLKGPEWWGLIVEEKASPPLTKLDLGCVITLVTGATLRALCSLAACTHDELARMTGLSRTTIHRMFSTNEPLAGVFKHKTVEQVVRIFPKFGIRFYIDPDGLLAFSHQNVPHAPGNAQHA